MMNKGGQKTKYKSVDMSIVNKLQRWQKEINVALAGTGYSCNLHPKTSEPCTSCKYREKCRHYGWERDYIYKKEEAERTSKVRERKNDKEKEKQNVITSHFETAEPVYPCEPFDYACPNRQTCNEGQNCPWKEE